jgi:hypothetical protein
LVFYGSNKKTCATQHKQPQELLEKIGATHEFYTEKYNVILPSYDHIIGKILAECCLTPNKLLPDL